MDEKFQQRPEINNFNTEKLSLQVKILYVCNYYLWCNGVSTCKIFSFFALSVSRSDDTKN